MRRLATVLGCAWVLWAQIVAIEVMTLDYEWFSVLESYETKDACLRAADRLSLEAGLRTDAHRKRLEARCLPQGMHPRDAR
jgi:hypothetical protein